MSNNVLSSPAKVGGVRFGVGIDWETVIRAAQRNYQDSLIPDDSTDSSPLALRVAELMIELSRVKRVANDEAQKLVALAAERDALAVEVDAANDRIGELTDQLNEAKQVILWVKKNLIGHQSPNLSIGPGGGIGSGGPHGGGQGSWLMYQKIQNICGSEIS